MIEIRNLNIWKNEGNMGSLYQSKVKTIQGAGMQLQVHSGSKLADMDISELGFSPRAYNSLRRGNCNTVGDILRMAEVDPLEGRSSEKSGLLRIRNLGTKTEKEIMTRIADIQKEILEEERHSSIGGTGKARIVVKPARNDWGKSIAELHLSPAAEAELVTCGIYHVKDLYRAKGEEGEATGEPGWYAVREVFDRL